MVQELERSPLPLDELTKFWRKNEECSVFEVSLHDKKNETFKLLEKIKQENEEKSSLGWRMKLIYLSLMNQRLMNTRNKLGRKKTEPLSLIVELVKMEEWRLQILFSHNEQEDKA